VRYRNHTCVPPSTSVNGEESGNCWDRWSLGLAVVERLGVGFEEVPYSRAGSST